jgi:hypothetical protein
MVLAAFNCEARRKAAGGIFRPTLTTSGAERRRAAAPIFQTVLPDRQRAPCFPLPALSLSSRSSTGRPLIPAPGRTVGKWHLLIDRSSYICYFGNEFVISTIFFVATRCRAQPCTRGSLHLCQRPDGLPGVGHYPAVLLFATPRAIEDSCGEGAAVADNFL